MLMLRQNQGFIVEGQHLPLDHPAHPNNKGGVLVKAIKTMMKKKPKRKNGAPSNHVLSNTMNTTPTQPSGSYAV